MSDAAKLELSGSRYEAFAALNKYVAGQRPPLTIGEMNMLATELAELQEEASSTGEVDWLKIKLSDAYKVLKSVRGGTIKVTVPHSTAQVELDAKVVILAYLAENEHEVSA